MHFLCIVALEFELSRSAELTLSSGSELGSKVDFPEVENHSCCFICSGPYCSCVEFEFAMKMSSVELTFSAFRELKKTI